MCRGSVADTRVRSVGSIRSRRVQTCAMDRAEIRAAIAEHAAELDRMGALLDGGPLGPDLRAELTLLARAVLEVHDRQMPLMIALQRGDDSLDDLRDPRAKRSSTAAIATRRGG